MQALRARFVLFSSSCSRLVRMIVSQNYSICLDGKYSDSSDSNALDLQPATINANETAIRTLTNFDCLKEDQEKPIIQYQTTNPRNKTCPSKTSSLLDQ